MLMQPVILVCAVGPIAHYLGDGSAMLMTTLQHTMASGLRVVLVAGPALADALGGLLATRDMVVLPPGEASQGQAIAQGVAATGDAPGWLVVPAQSAGLQPASLRAVAGALRSFPVAFGQHRGQRGYPLGFAAELYSELVNLRDDEAMRRLLARYPAEGIELDDQGVLTGRMRTLEMPRLRRRRA